MTTLLGETEQPTVAAYEAGSGDIASDDRTGLTRRVFGVLVGVTVAGTAAAGGLLAAGASAGPQGVRTSFGSVRLTGAERQLRFPPANGPGGSGSLKASGAAHDGHGTTAVGTTMQPANSTWGEHLALQLEVRNDSAQPVLFAPGQLRLQIRADGPTVTNRDAQGVTGPLPPESTSSFWIDFLVPSDVTTLSAEFTDPGGGGVPLALELPPVLNRPGSLAVDHD